MQIWHVIVLNYANDVDLACNIQPDIINSSTDK